MNTCPDCGAPVLEAETFDRNAILLNPTPAWVYVPELAPDGEQFRMRHTPGRREHECKAAA